MKVECNGNFLTIAVYQLFIYKTPKKIIDYIENQKIKAILGNPPYKIAVSNQP